MNQSQQASTIIYSEISEEKINKIESFNLNSCLTNFVSFIFFVSSENSSPRLWLIVCTNDN
ncbi:hypothetical protein DERP_004744 [Dermatophagoides pteronyssinus]|uniref:Uncharacterized protein n=1 Tax=Dermatophagoides pteronyssinus TaxID=6956 RepID=A0ABQ8JPR0_DERPT|nr:hypothetical protein DERP_004744 [Dermatophagoides pteronyssinus]